ncbi:hypothetical protein [Mesorhizobium sp.]|nr:hypothetical protein [Mesorhizobium sp.]
MTETTLAGVCDILIRNGCLITMDAKRSVYARGAVAIVCARILAPWGW